MKHLEIDVQNELKAVNEFADLENIVDELASHKMSLLSVPHADNELQDVRSEIISGMELVVQWINERLETGFWSYEMCEELRDMKAYVRRCLIELTYMVEYSITVNYQVYEFGKRWEDTPTKVMTVQGLSEQDCRGLAYHKMKDLSDYEETEIRYTVNNSSQGNYVGHEHAFRQSLKRKEQQQ